jgi:hypothetical protein
MKISGALQSASVSDLMATLKDGAETALNTAQRR